MRNPRWHLARLGRRAVGAAIVALVGGLLVLAGTTQLAGLAGLTPYVIHGGSMEPALPLGSIVLVAHVDPATIRPGDIITVRTDTGVVFSHRVVAVLGAGDGIAFRTRGDANATAEAQPAPARAVVGRIELAIPVAGFVQGMLGQAFGIVSLVTLLGALLLAFWELEDLEASQRRRLRVLTAAGPIQRRKAAA